MIMNKLMRQELLLAAMKNFYWSKEHYPGYYGLFNSDCNVVILWKRWYTYIKTQAMNKQIGLQISFLEK